MTNEDLRESIKDFFKNRKELAAKVEAFIDKYAEILCKKLELSAESTEAVMQKYNDVIKQGITKAVDDNTILDTIANKWDAHLKERDEEKKRADYLDSMRFGSTYESVKPLAKQTFREAIETMSKKVLKENAYGTFEEYIAKLNDLWDSTQEGLENAVTMDEILKNKWYHDLVADLYDSETEPSKALEEIENELANDTSLEDDIEQYQTTEDDYNVDEELDDEYLDDEYYDENGEHYPRYRDAVDSAEEYYNSPEVEYADNELAVHEALDLLRQHGFVAEPSMLTEAREFDSMDAEHKEGLRRLKNNYSSAKSNHALNTATQIDRYLRQFASFIPHVPNARGRALIMRWIGELNDRRAALNLPTLSVNPETGAIGTDTAAPAARPAATRPAATRRVEVPAAARGADTAPRVTVPDRAPEEDIHPAAEDDTRPAGDDDAPETEEPTRRRNTHMERRRRIRIDRQTVAHPVHVKQTCIFVEYGPDADTLQETRTELNSIADSIRDMYQGEEIRSYIEPVTIIENVPDRPNTISAVITSFPDEHSRVRDMIMRKINDVFVFVEVTAVQEADIEIHVPAEVEIPEEYEVEVEDAPTPEEAAQELVNAAAEGEVETREVATRRQPRTDIVRRLAARTRWKVTFKVEDSDETETVYVAARSAEEARAIVSRDPDDGGAYWNVGEILSVEED